MTRKQIDAARETRLWLGQVIVPAITAVVLLASKSEVRDFAKQKYDDVKSWAKQKFHK